MSELWREASYTIGVGVGNTITIDGEVVQESNQTVDQNDIAEVTLMKSQWIGQCVSVVPKKLYKANEIMTVIVMFPSSTDNDNLSVPLEFDMILHESPESKFSLIPGDILDNGAKIVRFQIGTLGSVSIGRRLKTYNVQKKQGLCKEYAANDSPTKCRVKEIVAKRYLQPVCDNNGTTIEPCLIPQAANLLDYLNVTGLPECIKQFDYVCMNQALSSQPDTDDPTKCPEACSKVQYRISKITHPLNIQGLTIVFLYYQDNNVEKHEEYLVFDFSSIVTAVGGSLGLFLGFSFFQCSSQIAFVALKMVQTITNKIGSRNFDRKTLTHRSV